MPHSTVTRRSFLSASVASGATTLSAAAYARVLGANERVGVGFIGYGLIGKRHVLDFQEQPDVRLVAVAEAHRGRLDEAQALIGGGSARATPTSASCSTTGRSTPSSSRRRTTGTR